MELTLPAISDEVMRQSMTTTRAYTVAILHKGPAYDPPRSDPTIWEHGRRNFALRAAGLLSIVCPIRDASTTAGIGIFAADSADVERILAGDPADPGRHPDLRGPPRAQLPRRLPAVRRPPLRLASRGSRR